MPLRPQPTLRFEFNVESMCGIAGILERAAGRPVEVEALARMGGVLAHRGPDGEGIWTGVGVGLVHRRLSIIDLEGGRQPMTNEDGSIWVVFNGEIYNFQRLRDELGRKGHRFQTRSDTEVIVHLYEEEGERLVARLRGMFAFALWDAKRRRLVLARDRVGIKPLYYYRDAERLVFGSELKAALALPGVPRDIDPQALEDYLAFGVVPGERSIFAGIKKLPPAHTLVVGADAFDAEPVRYWRLELRPNETLSIGDWQEAIREKLTETVRLHMIADVPVGAFLSGGIDSSIVVGLASEVSSEPIRTFSMGFRESRFNELPFARKVAEHFGTRHTEEIVTADAVSLLDELTYFYDEPFADSSAVPTYLMSQVTARSVKVVLSGDGGDEAFGGYSRYAHDLREAALRRRLPRWFRTALGPLADAWPKADWLPKPLRLKTALQNLSLDAGPAYANTLTLCRQPLRRQLLAPDVREQLNGHRPEDAVLGAHRTAPASDPLAGMIAADVALLLPDDFLVKVDRASMACGLEVRPPLLDHELLELAATIPSGYKVRNGSTKWILKESFRERLPTGILDRPKQGFEIPIDAWLRGPLRGAFEERVLSPASSIGDLVERRTVRQLFDTHLSSLGRHGSALWALLVLSSWAGRYLGREASAREIGSIR